ncbi:MAG TPA: efflux RND transporter periplasmic adaptor subunit [Anaeromyxobacteraceae bacterium]|nr:efflux RND transporter periplasmic adaptor subunit [Anaeromyxobacteraceae bacterium]
MERRPVDALEAPPAARPAVRPAPARGRRRRWALGAAIVVLAVVAVAVVRARSGQKPAGQGSPAAGAQAGAARAVPVSAAAIARRDVPIYLQGLGNVLALKTVTVRTQVDGTLQSVSFREGQAVRKGDLLAQIDPRPFQAQLHQAEGALKRDEAQLLGARRNLVRYQALVDQKLIPQQQVDDQAATVGQLEGAVQIDRAAIETARLNLDYARISSPVDGVTGIRVVDPGNLVRASDQNGIVVVTQLDPIAVIFTLPQDDLGAVATELAAGPLQVDVYSRDGNTRLASGNLGVIDNQINQATSTIRLKATVPNPKRQLWPNQFVNARLRLTTRKGALAMPATALQRGPSGTFVYVVGADATAAVRPVAIDVVQGDVALVASGVNEGEKVVTDGQNQLRPGAKVAVREPGQGGGAGPRQGQAEGQGSGPGQGQGSGQGGGQGSGQGPGQGGGQGQGQRRGGSG